MLVILLGFTGLAIDAGHVSLTAHQLQNAADAAALAGVRYVRDDLDLARTAAINTAGANRAGNVYVQLDRNSENAENGDIVIGDYDREIREFTATHETPNAVKVTAGRTAESLNGALPLYFGPVVGVDITDIARSAIAMIGGGTGAGLIALNPTEPCALDVYGNAILDVDNGAIQVNSESNRAACIIGNAVIDGPEMNVTGGVRFTGGATYDGDLNEGAVPLEDPLAFLEPPVYDPMDDLGIIDTGGTFGPGYYSGGVYLTGNHTVYLEPGVYVLDGEGLRILAGVNFTAHNVMFYIVGTGNLYISGNSVVTITPEPLDSGGYYAGISIFQARDNTNESTIIGTGDLNLEGTLYFPAAHLQIGGTGDGFGNQLIADTIEVFGDGAKTIVYDGRFAAVGNKIFLVE